MSAIARGLFLSLLWSCLYPCQGTINLPLSRSSFWRWQEAVSVGLCHCQRSVSVCVTARRESVHLPTGQCTGHLKLTNLSKARKNNIQTIGADVLKAPINTRIGISVQEANLFPLLFSSSYRSFLFSLWFSFFLTISLLPEKARTQFHEITHPSCAPEFASWYPGSSFRKKSKLRKRWLNGNNRYLARRNEKKKREKTQIIELRNFERYRHTHVHKY